MFETQWFKGKKATVMGLGLFGGGAAVTRFLCRLGARVTVTDLRGEEVLAPSLSALEGLGIRFVLGKHEESDFSDADMVVVNPAVPPSSPFLEIARAKGLRIESEMNLFFQACRSRWVVGVTGSNGKSTTTSLTGAMLREAGFETRVGGNIGKPLIEEALDISKEDRVVLELSSFQLEDLGRLSLSPPVAVLTNLTPNHLDRHGTFPAYVRAKETIFKHQRDRETAVLNADDEQSMILADRVPGRIVLFSTEKELDEGYFLAAAAAAAEAGAPPGPIGRAIASFESIPHRLERIAERSGALWFNDSIATTPESTVAALGAFDGPIVLIAGGYDKKLDLGAMCRAAARKARVVVLLGATAEKLKVGMEEAGGGAAVLMAKTLAEAVSRAASSSRPGDTVVLSPGAASYDMFLNFEDRGNRFRKLVFALPD
ncbi:MAG: UDP-N-acetylmuramoyl-L-alanine--D-glutamate ligase [Planctomycetota bacterium]|jgi:UDP-N-acetylmuramoylalanine--D-glutamate ligase